MRLLSNFMATKHGFIVGLLFCAKSDMKKELKNLFDQTIQKEI